MFFEKIFASILKHVFCKILALHVLVDKNVYFSSPLPSLFKRILLSLTHFVPLSFSQLFHFGKVEF